MPHSGPYDGATDRPFGSAISDPYAGTVPHQQDSTAGHQYGTELAGEFEVLLTEQQEQAAAEVYRGVQHSRAFQDIRHSYRSFVFPATAVFLGWYLLYVTLQAAAPELMRTPLAGPFSVAWLLGLLQFVSTFLLTWLYSRNARTKRDRAALGLRWDTQDQLR
ncbi:DUF485 domain-containing protein [Kitasatospora sp. NPDC058965]|uniref:DUF485 domain-containing protein n=1 Tax=Kitasatospora sp. NPDC058965 TaxID=3346682 RepID=UPI0036B22510